EGRPLAQAAIVLKVENTRGPYHASAETGADGGYRIGVLPDGPTSLQVSVPLANGSERKKSVRFELNVHETLRQDFDFPVAGTVQGQVRGLRAEEQANVLVLRGAPQQLDTMTFDQLMNLHENVVANVNVASDGSFAFEAIDPGEYVLVITASQQGSVDFRSASQIINVVADTDVSVRIMMR
ncbi:MAG: carboxypeptidase-like regulatory domain-containing protein, partial [Candidatus Hydrogenedentes bacterium]|nr:carboxypeptidase-like regulatory domain-containing protein [Candidatus Hydrogenedentota bacterium]